MTGEPQPSDAARQAMVARQLRSRGIADERVLAAMSRLPREAFIDPDHQRMAYADAAVPIASGQTISQPYMVARMTELLRTEPDDLVLEIGTGSGYQAAVLAMLGCRVVSWERHADLARTARQHLRELGLDDRVDIRVGDGSLGDPDDGPFDGIIITAATPRIRDELRRQLRDGGRLVAPVGPRDQQELIVVERSGDEFLERSDGACVFVPLVGAGGFPG